MSDADFAYQEDGIEWLRRRVAANGTAYLGDEPGLGKTRQLLLASVEPVLWVAPALVLDSGTITDEVERWTPGLDVTQVPYSSLNARERTPKGGTRPINRLRPELRRERESRRRVGSRRH